MTNVTPTSLKGVTLVSFRRIGEPHPPPYLVTEFIVQSWGWVRGADLMTLSSTSLNYSLPVGCLLSLFLRVIFLGLCQPLKAVASQAILKDNQF